jgi:uncharacterized membrane protein YeaQ/YmgE (transglycosylase-associated protein family)
MIMMLWLAQTTDPLAQNVTLSFNLGSLISAAVIGLIAGFLASLLVRGRNFSVIGCIILGMIGGVVGNFLFTVLAIPVSAALATGITIRIIDVIAAFVGALIVLILFIVLFGRRNL